MTPEREALLEAITDGIIADAYADGAIVSELSRKYCRHGAEAALAAIEAHGVRLVPVEPTQEMVDAGLRATKAGQSVRNAVFDANAASPYAPSSNDPHPWYAGGCDALGPNGTCAECAKIADTKARVSPNDHQKDQPK